MDEMKSWFDGYHLRHIDGFGSSEQENEISIYCPMSVVESALSRSFDSYWNQTETFEALETYTNGF
ncbi:MAG: hypothetical protein FWG10_10105 [Eubacteriaceae bacterium]|nr:hypothetical protein [Eubacteriaceae bacterium]